MRKIVVTGPESSGKSLLCRQLAAHFGVQYIPEYARIYLEENGPDYNIDILRQLVSAHLQFQKEEIREARGEMIFLDTDLINYHVWSHLVFGHALPEIEKAMPAEQSHLYLLMSPDLPWEEDPLRENPGNRQHIFDLHLEEIKKRGRPYKIIKGQGEIRFLSAVEAVRSLFI